uniref:Ig-like domain-containing protein n=1 Tax=Timema monikensis TaxID=170555 RepID=A0A7R9E0H6_9NEOP|nr:unnamed protein product [Timema monikensis]
MASRSQHLELPQKKEETGTAPHFVQPLKPQVVEGKQPALLQCVVVGQPMPTVKWFVDNKEVKPSKAKEITYTPETGLATLKILKPKEEDQAIYSVRADNTFGKAECRANLILREAVQVYKPEVLRAPKITRPLEAKIVHTGKPINLEAEFEGKPTPDVKWYRNGKEITPTSDIKIVVEENKTTLHIPKSRRENVGKYEVRAMNPVGEARTSGSVAVKEPEAEREHVIPPRFIQPLRPQIVAEGEVVILETIVESFPTSSFQWFLHNIPITSSPELRVVTEDNRTMLLVSEITPEQAGNYTCRAENVGGSVTCTASVNSTPDTEWEEVVELESPMFIKKIANVRVMDGEQVLFTCKVTGKPTPKVTWFHKNEPVKEAKDVFIYQDTEGVCKLAISEVFPEDAGEYTCQAINRVGETICAASLVVEAYEYVPDSEIASVTVTTSLVTGQSGSEEDLLAEKETITEITKKFATEETLRAPEFTTRLHELIPVRDGELTRLEVKVEGRPRPKVRWFKQGVELTPSKDFQMEDYNDGTSVLTITEVYPDDEGEIICEASNELGVAKTVTELVVEGILGTKEYRKPEWVTHMEELQDQLRGNTTFPCVSPCMPRHGSSSNMSVDSLDTCRLQAPSQRRRRNTGGSVTSLDVSVGDDSVFVSSASSLSDDHTTARSTVHAPHVPFTLNLLPSPTQFNVSVYPTNEQECQPSSMSAGSDFANTIITDYLQSHRHSISAAIEALETTAEKVTVVETTTQAKTRHVVESNVVKIRTERLGSNSRCPNEIGQNEEETVIGVEVPVLHLHQREEKKEVVEIVYVTENGSSDEPPNNFFFLPPIRESSEPSTASSSNRASKSSDEKSAEESTMRLLSASCENLPTVVDASMKPSRQTKYQTYPRSKIPVLSPKRTNACYSVPEDSTKFPLEPRELDPSAFQQLHTADSQEELQEFLLLESECMTTEGRGLAAAFVTSDDDHCPSDDDHDHDLMSATQCVPTFVQEIRDTRATETETVVFECQYSGTPVPDIVWYHNDKTIRNTKNVQIRIKNNKTTCTIHKATLEDEGTYVCKATSDVGVETTRARLYVQALAPEEKKRLEIQQAKEEKDKVKLERVRLDKKREDRRKKIDNVTFEEDSKATVDIQEVQVLESTKHFTQTIEKGTAERILHLQEPVEVSAIASCKKIDDEQVTEIQRPEERAKEITPVQESVTVSEVQPEYEVKAFTEKISQKVARKSRWGVQEPVMVSEVQTQDLVEEFEETTLKRQAQKKVSIQESVNISEITTESTAEEFQGKIPKKKATTSVPVQEPVVVSEVTSENLVKEFEETIEKTKAKRIVPIQESVTYYRDASVEKLTEKKPKTRKAKVEKKPTQEEKVTVMEVKPEEIIYETEEVITKIEEIMRTEEMRIATEVSNLMNFVRADEFGPGESPLRELATIGFLVRQGVAVSEITTMYQADKFPALRTPEAQSAMVQLVEREGHSPIISQILTEESTTDEVAVGSTVGFRAFMRMVELKHVSVEEVITHFAPEDFWPHAWESTEATQTSTREVTEKVHLTEQSEVHIQEKKKTTKKKTRTRDETEIQEILQETDVRTASKTAVDMRQQKPQQTPDNREEGVTITEVPTDDQVTTVVTQRSLAIVTQPDDKSDTRKQTEEEEQEEELIIIEKTKEGKVTRQKKKKIVRQESEEEIEIEIEIVGGGKRKVKKTIKAIRPDTEEETITEEYTEELKPLPDTSLKGLPLISTPSQVSESIPTARTTVRY